MYLQNSIRGNCYETELNLRTLIYVVRMTSWLQGNYIKLLITLDGHTVCYDTPDILVQIFKKKKQ